MVALSRDERSVARDVPIVRRLYRYQVQGPNAPQVLNKLNGSPIPEIKFFNMGEINIAGRKVRALRHGMAGVPGLELWGPHQEREEIRAAIVEAGQEFGLEAGGVESLRHQHPGIGMDPITDSRCLHRRKDEALPPMALWKWL